MNMKKIILYILMSWQTLIGTCQSFVLQNAKNAYSGGNLEVAITEIDKATRHPQTKDWAVTWYYSYLIHKDLATRGSLDILGDEDVYGAIENAISMCLKLDENREYYDAIMNSFGEIVGQLQKEADSFQSSKRHQNALEASEYVLAIASAAQMAKDSFYFNCAVHAFKARALAKAVTYYDHCIQAKYKLEASFLGKIKCYKRMDDYQGTLRTAKEAHEALPQSEQILELLINVLIARELFFSAEEILSNAIVKIPSSATVYYLRGLVVTRMSQENRAILDFQMVLRLDPRHLGANYQLGKLYLERGKTTGIVGNFEKAKPLLEKVEELGGKDDKYLATLEDLYLQIHDLANYQRIRKSRSNE